MRQRLKPELAVGTLTRHYPDDAVRTCERCQRVVYLHDKISAEAPAAMCLECFVDALEQSPRNEKFVLMLPANLTPAEFIRMLRSGQRPGSN